MHCCCCCCFASPFSLRPRPPPAHCISSIPISPRPIPTNPQHVPKRPRVAPLTAHLPPPRRTPLHRPCSEPRADLPQTIEHALLSARRATQRALQAAVTRPDTRLRVELPMGRSRRFWQRMSPPSLTAQETPVLAMHFADMFRGLRVALVLPDAAAVRAAQVVPWLTLVTHLEEVEGGRGGEGGVGVEGAQVVVIAGAERGDAGVAGRVVKACAAAEAVVLFNCFLDMPVERNPVEGFQHAYVCRALDKCAVMRESPRGAWMVFVEIAVFQYEWVGNREERPPDDPAALPWVPAQAAVEAFAMARGAQRKGRGNYFDTPYAGCEAGFWPFMTIACTQVLPLDGRLLAESARKKAEKKTYKGANRPFGFF